MTQADGGDFAAAAAALRELGDKELTKRVSASMRKTAEPLGTKVISEGSADMPSRGGFRAIVAAAKMQQSNSLNGNNPSVKMAFKTKPSHNLKAIDAGILRHPVFARPGRKRVWRTQSVRAQAFSTPFNAGSEAVAADLTAVLDDVAGEIAARVRKG